MICWDTCKATETTAAFQVLRMWCHKAAI